MAYVSYGAAARRSVIHQAESIVGAVALVVVLVSSLALGANRPVAWTLLAMIILGLFLVQIVLDVLRPPNAASRRLLGPALLYLGVLLWALLQIWPGALGGWADPAWSHVPDATPRISSDPVAGAHHILRLAAYGMVFWIIVRAAEDSTRAMHLLMGVAIFSTLLAGFGIFTAWTGTNPILGERATGRVSASFVNRNSYATYAIFGLTANLALYLHRARETPASDPSTSKRLRNFLEGFFRGNWIFALGVLLCLAALLFTESRAGLVSGLVALLALAFAQSRNRRLRNPWVVGSVLAIVVFGAVFLSSGVGTRLMATGPDEARFEVYALIAQAIAERPWTGYGIGSFADAFRAWIPQDLGALEWDLAHNSYLENAFELGVPAALALYAALLWIAAVILQGVLSRQRNRVFAVVAFASIAGAGFHSLFDFSLQMPATASLFAVVLALGWSQAFSTRKIRSVRVQAPRPNPAEEPEAQRPPGL